MMKPSSFNDFKDTYALEAPPKKWPLALQAMWYDGKGDWERAHYIAQGIPGHLGSQIHAYLHRKEGDRFNAGYWYNRAGKNFPNITLEEEFEELVTYIISLED